MFNFSVVSSHQYVEENGEEIVIACYSGINGPEQFVLRAIVS
jgi:hypothetical protein